MPSFAHDHWLRPIATSVQTSGHVLHAAKGQQGYFNGKRSIPMAYRHLYDGVDAPTWAPGATHVWVCAARLVASHPARIAAGLGVTTDSKLPGALRS